MTFQYVQPTEAEKELIETRQNLRMARFNMSTLRSEKEILERYYWKNK